MITLHFPIRGPLLRPGARVGVFAPSGAWDPARLESGLAVLRSWDIEPRLAPGLAAPAHRYLAATDASRLADLCWALGEPSLDAAWMVRGGYGILHLLQDIPYDTLPKDRLVLGFSDGTLLLDVLASRGWRRPVHGPVLQTLAAHIDDASREATRTLLVDRSSPAWRLDLLCGPLLSEPIEAPLRGGNLCSLATLCGTPFQPGFAGCLVLLEEIGEPPYKVDRLLTQITQAGMFKGVRGVILGDFVDCEPPPGASFALRDILTERLSRLNVPTFTGAPVGHARRNEPFLVGGVVRVERE